jgi:glycerol-3-phosphate dehydrogenase
MNRSFDVVVIGGGIHGVGVAQAAAAGGYSVLLLEKTALAAGTSSRSSKLIHGGLRYLESAQFHLVRESLRERAILLKIAPELVRLVPFHIPIYRHTQRRTWQIRAGLSMYAALGGFAPATRFHTIARSQWAALEGLETRALDHVFQYHDAQTDDAALTRAVMRSAQSLDAELTCPAEFVGARCVPQGFDVRYRDARGEQECRARTLVNAAGPWANTALARIDPAATALPFELVQGAHIELDTPAKRAIYYVEAQDRRAVFVMPWHGHTLVGTTETRARPDPDHLAPTPAEIDYLQQTFARYFPNDGAALRASFAGARVLPGGSDTPFHRSRETILHLEERTLPGLLTIYGGKLTGYRAAAERVVRRLLPFLPMRKVRGDTRSLRLGANS